jgi:arylsulfatase A-like enzyme
MMRLPGETPRRIDEPVSLLDLAPTLLSYLDLPVHGNFQGRGDILESSYSAAGRAFHFTIQGLTQEDGVLLDDWKYMVNWDRRERRLFDLTSDPEEQTDLLEERPDRAEVLDRELGEFLMRQLAYYGQQGWRAGQYPPALAGGTARGSR